MTTETPVLSVPPSQSGYRRLAYLLSRYARPYWRKILFMVTANVGVTLLTMLNPIILAPILDVALGRVGNAAIARPLTWSTLSLENLGAAVLHLIGADGRDNAFIIVIYLSLTYFAVNVAAEILRFAGYLLGLSVRIGSARDLQTDMYRHVLSLPMGFFLRHRTGDLVARLEHDTAETTYGFEGILGPAITSTLLIAFYGTLLILTNPILTIAAGVAVGLHYAVSRALRKPVRKRLTAQFSALGNVAAVIQETLLSIRVVKSFASESFEMTRFGKAVAALLRANFRFGFLKNIEAPLRTIADRLVDLGFLLPAAYELLNGRLSPASFLLFLYVVRSIVQPINALGQVITVMNTTIAASERVFTVLEEPVTLVDGVETPPRLAQGIQLDRVNFGYDDGLVLRDISLSIQRGERVAFVGPSGAGKSTLFDLILRLYDPLSGKILMDGKDVRGFRQTAYRSHFGVVSQESLLFNATIRDNIAYGRNDLSDADIAWAAKVANAADFIEQLRDGYATMVGDRGIRLSGGQRQRIAIARAVVGRPDILLLDEATSALDSESERQVQDAIDRITRETTSLIIAHRLSTVLHADKIVVVNEGRIEAMGRHDELLIASETYQKFHKLQFEDTRANGSPRETIDA